MQIKTGGRVYGNVYKGVFNPLSPASPLGGTFKALPSVPVVVPADLSQIRSYTTYTLPNDPAVYSAELHAGGIALGTGGIAVSWGPSPANPAGVHIVDGDLSLLAGASVSGSLIVRGNLTLNLATTTVNVTGLQPTLPTLLVGNNIDFTPSVAGGTLAVSGACWVGGKVDAAAANTNATNFNVTGALLCDGGLFPSALYPRSLIRYRAELVKIHDFTDTGRTPKSVRVLSWRDGR
jgi:hypothetical protein